MPPSIRISSNPFLSIIYFGSKYRGAAEDAPVAFAIVISYMNGNFSAKYLL
jgi:hypothetical protein